MRSVGLVRGAWVASALGLAVLCPVAAIAAAAFPEFVDPHPAVGNSFGFSIAVLSTGNVVIASPGDDAAASNAGAVYVFDGSTGALISTLRGSSTDDQVGSGGITALPNGNFVIASPLWGAGDLGAVTWGNGTSGISGLVSSANSLVGSTANDQVGGFGVIVLANGNYVVRNPSWDRGATLNAGAVTWGNGTTGTSGTIGIGNSLVGLVANDNVGSGGVLALANGSYVVLSPNWDGAGFANAGAATWGNGATGRIGAVSASNSLIGALASDQIGSGGATELANGNYVVCSPLRDEGAAVNAGAATWGSGTAGVTGFASAANSLLGSQTNDQVSLGGVTDLANGNYVVVSPLWHNVNVVDAGAVTWADGSSGIVGTVSGANSLIGAAPSDQIGSGGVTALSNGNYVVRSPICNILAVTDAGAATWGNGATGRSGIVTASNSLYGTATNDQVSSGGVTALTNGHYVVRSPLCNVGASVDAGAVTWCDGTSGATGSVSASNSLVGSKSIDQVGNAGVIALPGGNYVVASSFWDHGAAVDAGAATWANGATGISGAISSANSLVGSTTDDHVAANMTLLTNGNYVVSSPDWDNTFADAGAVTWGSGALGVSGAVSSGNSLVGAEGDRVGTSVTPLMNGNYVVASPNWNNGIETSAGAVTWGDGAVGTIGEASSANSLVGAHAGDQVGTFVTALSDGDYVVTSPNCDNGNFLNAGAATWGDGAGGTSGSVSASNSVVSWTSNTNLFPAIEDPVHGTFVSRFADEGGGHVRVGPVAPFLISSASDIPADQGGWLRLTFVRFYLDYDGAAPAVTTYGVWRHIPGTLPSSAGRGPVDPADAIPSDAADILRVRSLLPATLEARTFGGRLFVTNPVPGPGESAATFPPGTWELVTGVPAVQQGRYVVAVPTISNAAANDYVVTAHTQLPSVWVITAPLSGQSVDNLAPAQPAQFAANYTNGQTDLQWASNTEPDLASYSVHRGSSAGFTPTLANRIASQIGTHYSDVGPAGAYYKVCAVDVNGNASTFALVTPDMTTDVAALEVAFALHGVRPNPVSARSIQVAFALPDATPARLELIDVSGRAIVVRDVGSLGAGRHIVDLAERRHVRAGVYWVRLTQGADRAIRRAAVVE